MKVKVINIDGKNTDNIEISDKIFSVKPSKSIVKSILDWQLNKFKPRTYRLWMVRFYIWFKTIDLR